MGGPNISAFEDCSHRLIILKYDVQSQQPLRIPMRLAFYRIELCLMEGVASFLCALAWSFELGLRYDRGWHTNYAERMKGVLRCVLRKSLK